TSTGPGAGCRSSGPGGRRGRTRRCVTTCRGGASCPGSSHPLPASGREPLAALVAPALERHSTRARAHARAEAVHACAPALLWLVGALHRVLGDRGERRREAPAPDAAKRAV